MNRFACGREIKVKNRREFLAQSAFGFGALALGHLLDREGLGSVWAGQNAVSNINPLAPRPPHFPAKAKSVIFIFLRGGLSQVDSFDPKPALERFDGHPLPDSFRSDNLNAQFIKISEAKLMAPSFAFRQHGESGLPISDLFPALTAHADELAVIRSCYHDAFLHGPATTWLTTGSIRLGHASAGAWVLYGLGVETDNLPAYVVMTDSGLRVPLPADIYGSGFLPAIYQGTRVETEGAPFENLSPPAAIGMTRQRTILDQVQTWNRRHLEGREDDTRLEARIASYELAFRMQTGAPELVDVSREPPAVRERYGLDQEVTSRFGHMCLLSRRMVERGVRFVQLFSNDWDGHEQCPKNHQESSDKIDRPVAGLLADLKERGLLESTLVVCAGEFGRTPVMQGTRGRDHNPYGFTIWMAGGGVQGGKAIGATDELGFLAVEDKVHVRDIHATMLSLLGLDHEKLTFLVHGLKEKLTGVEKVENNLYQKLIKA